MENLIDESGEFFDYNDKVSEKTDWCIGYIDTVFPFRLTISTRSNCEIVSKI